jgi:hypothetical protein
MRKFEALDQLLYGYLPLGRQRLLRMSARPMILSRVLLLGTVQRPALGTRDCWFMMSHPKQLYQTI